MKRLILLTAVAIAFSQAAVWAQDAPKAEAFAGYSFINFEAGENRDTVHGWQASVAGNLNPKLGIVADFGGHYESGLHFYEYLFGPRYNHRMAKTNVFGHALFGGTSAGGDGASDSNFAMAFGGGLDIKANDMISIRAVQFDWLLSKNDDTWSKKDVRLGFGVVFALKK
jgi:opacity protein-like surface antigen